MNKKISGKAFGIAFDEVNSRYFLLSERSVRVFDWETNAKITSLKDIANPNQIFISYANNMIVVKSTVGAFAFYSLNDLTLLGKVRWKGNVNTDARFCCDEKEKKLFGICYKGLKQVFYSLSLETMQTTFVPLIELKCETTAGDKPITRYELHKVESGSFYLLRDFYDVGKESKIYECSYGRYEVEHDMLMLKEKVFSTNERHLTLLDLGDEKEVELLNRLCEEFHLQKVFLHVFRNERGLFVITSKAVYQLHSDGTFEEVYRADWVMDYAEFRGRRYICTCDWVLIQGI
jgi:hypothetical protein